MSDLQAASMDKKQKRFITIQGKDIDNDENDPNDTTPINFVTLNNKGVSGSGMPITMALCRKVIMAYYDRQKKVHNLFRSLLNKAMEEEKKLNKEKQKLKEESKKLLDPDNEIVSGIYGRDTLLHILSQEGCEGIRYVNCIYRGEKSIVLFGVDIEGEPIGGTEKFLIDNPSENVLIYEVKEESKTMAEILSMINSKEEFIKEVILS